MLNIYIQGIDKVKSNVIDDIDSEFENIEVKNNKLNREIIRSIDDATLLDCKYIEDKFGCKLPIGDLSTGCKAALILAQGNSRVVNLSECGHNAIKIILRLVKDGEATIEYNTSNFEYTDEESKSASRMSVLEHKDYIVPVDICNDRYRFTSLGRLNYYLQNEKPFNPDLSIAGVEELHN